MEAGTSGKAEVWRRRIEEQMASGQSIQAWCRASGLPAHSFCYWRGRLGLSPGPQHRQSRPSDAPVALTRVRLVERPLSQQSVAQQRAQQPLRLCLSSGHELILPASLAMASVAELILAIQRQA